MTAVVKIDSEKTLKELLNKSSASVVHLFAGWASECKQLQTIFSLLPSRHNRIQFIEGQAESLEQFCITNNIESVPTVLFFKKNEIVSRVEGFRPDEIGSQCDSLSKYCQYLPSSTNAPQISLDERLALLIKKAPVMLFMKGNPEHPQCGFSREIVGILNGHNIKYNTFNILEDNEVREGLKRFSDWPTYPQLYVDGDLVGGVDIVREMAVSNELSSIARNSNSNGDSLSLEERLKFLINQSKVMIFMKGQPEEPKCKFSRQLMELLKPEIESGLQFSSFNILADEEVRQGLKKYSDWPTYPQIYVKGQFIGGIQILNELKEEGALHATLNP